MKSKKFQLLSLFLCICTFGLFAQTSKSINLTTPGTLKNLVSDSETKSVTSLTVSGNIDARDFAFMRDKMKVLSILNLNSTTIKSYTGSDGTNSGVNTSYPDNEVPMYAFYNPYLFTYKSTLTNITLPANTISIGYLAFYYSWNLVGTVNIPASVKSITDYAFSGCSSISAFSVASSNTRYSSLNGVIFSKSQDTLFVFPQAKSGSYSIPSTVKHIGPSAFENCWNLTSVVLPSTIKSIGSYAFSYCSGIIGSLSLPTSLKKMDDGAFYGCWNLTGTVTIPSSLSEIGNYCFLESNNLKSFIVNSLNPTYASSNDILYSKNMDTLFICPSAKTGTLTIPTTVKLIGSHALYNCNKLTGAINIPAQVDYIGYYAFYGCSLITDFQVNPSNQYFTTENAVLLSKTKDRLLTYPITKTGTYQIPSTITEIDPGAFAFCENLTGELNIPSVVKTIGEYAFYNCKQIAGFTVDASNSAYSADNGLLFNRNKDTLLVCPFSKTGKYDIPSTVKHIGNSAFDGCLNLTEITIPNSTTSIGDYAFEYCTGITKIDIPKSTLSIGKGAFYSCTNLQKISIANPNPPILDYYALDLVNKSTCSLIVPMGAKTNYQNAPYWSEFSIINEYNFESALPAFENNKYIIYNINHDIFIKGTSSDNIVEIYDIKGRILSRRNATENTTCINIPMKGVYIVKINNSTNKIVI